MKSIYTLAFLLLYCYFSLGLNTPPVALRDELGCSPTLSFLFSRDSQPVFFDPLRLATDDNFARMREAELKHGRVAMVAVVSSLTITGVQENDFTAFLMTGGTPKIIKILCEWDLPSILKLFIFCGFLETLIFVQPSSEDMPGDYGVGYFRVRDKGENERSLVSELENGRLAMMVFLYFVLREISEDSTYWDSFQNFFTSHQA